MMWVTGIGAVVCLVYYGVIVCYSGFSTSFAWIWPLAAVFLLALTAGMAYSRFYPKRIPLWLSVPAFTFLGASVIILCVVEVMVFLGAASANMPNLDYVIVLGAKVEEGRISSSLQKRLDKAIEYSQRNPDTVWIVSGGQGRDEPASEAQMMYEYMRYNGVPEKQLVMEDRSQSTAQNISYSKEIIDRLEEERGQHTSPQPDIPPGPYMMAEDKPIQIGVLTSNLHVFRATQIARRWGIHEVCGIGAPSDRILFLHLCLRECAAILKDKLMGNM